MKRIILMMIAILGLSNTVLAQAEQVNVDWPTIGQSDWPMISHDPQRTGRSPFRGPQSPLIEWAADIPEGIFSGPVIGEEGNLYLVAAEKGPKSL